MSMTTATTEPQQDSLFSFSFDGPLLKALLPTRPPGAPEATTRPAATPRPELIAARYRKFADGMQRTLEALARTPFDGQNATRRRASFQASRAEDHRRAQEQQRVLYALADAAEAGTLHAPLANLTARRVVEALVNHARYQNENPGRSETERLPVPHLYPYRMEDLRTYLSALDSAGADALEVVRDWNADTSTLDATQVRTLHAALSAKGISSQARTCRAEIHSGLLDEVTHTLAFLASGLTSDEQVTAAVQAIRPYQSGPLLTEAELRAARIKKLERALIGADYPGYFPTPAPLARSLVDEAMIAPGMTVLEPSAGKGDLCDLIRDAGGVVSAIEPVTALRDVLLARGHTLVGSDLLTHQGSYDRVVMNPPFERRQDARHVQYAYELLNPGGRLVAIVSSGTLTGPDRDAETFRAFLSRHHAHVTANPEGSFKISTAGRATGVRTDTVILDRPE